MRKIRKHCTVSLPILKTFSGDMLKCFDSKLDRWKKKIEGYRDRLMEENLKMRNLDSARPKENDSDELAGTFRTLNVD